MSTIDPFIPNYKIRRKKNVKRIKDGSISYSIHEAQGYKFLVQYDSKDQIKASACRYCLAKTKRNPIGNGAYVFSICKDCLKEIDQIEPLKNSKKSKKRNRQMSTQTVSQESLDWIMIDQKINNGEAKVSSLSKEYKVSSAEFKQMLLDRYGKDTLEFKRGRNGGIRKVNAD